MSSFSTIFLTLTFTSLFSLASELDCISNACPNGCDDSNNWCDSSLTCVECFEDPCARPKVCNENELCLSDFCGGCNGRCISTLPCGRFCPEGCNGKNGCALTNACSNCLVDPCKDVKCAVNTECFADMCGGCNAHCVSTNSCGSHCPKGCNGLNGCPVAQFCSACLIDPCFAPDNPCNEDEICTSDYCNGCNAHCCTKSGKACYSSEDCCSGLCKRDPNGFGFVCR